MPARNALLACAVSVAIAAALTLAGHGSLDENLVYSLGIGMASCLSITVGRLWLTRRQEIRWPQGLHGLAGWLVVIAGTLFGFVVGMALGHIYSGREWDLADLLRGEGGSHPLLITAAASAATSFFFYSQGRSRFLMARIARAQRDAAEARLALLQSQLEPHMLFNTLANLRVLVATDPPRAETMLDHLIDYLRATLGASRAPLHPLAVEFARLNDYLELMAVRMGPRLAFTLDLPAELQAVPVPPLLLQPLAENAIRHGLEPVLAGGTITVRARQREASGALPARVELTVQDNGAGLAAGSTAPAATVDATRHFGLVQVRERLATLFGDQATLELIATSAGGTSARVVFPLNSTFAQPLSDLYPTPSPCPLHPAP